MRALLLAILAVLALSPARADGLSRFGPAMPGLCYASGVSGSTVPCVQDSQGWSRLLRLTDPADDLTVTTPGGMPRSMRDRARDVIRLVDKGAKCDGATDDTAAVQKAAQDGDAVGGARIIVPDGRQCAISAMIISRTGNTFVAGSRTQVTANTNGGDKQPGFLWIGPAGGTMFTWQPAKPGDALWGGCFLDIMLNGSTTAAIGANLDNTKQARCRGSVRNFRVAGIDMNSDSGVAGNFSQNNFVEYLDVTYGATSTTAAMHGVVMRGKSDGSVPATQNRVGKIDGLVKNGYLVKILHTDNAQIFTLHAAVDAGTGGAVWITHAPSGFRADHTFLGYVAGKIKIDPTVVGTHILHMTSEGGGIDAPGVQYHLGRLTDYVTGAAYTTKARAMVKRLPVTVRAVAGAGTTMVGGLFDAVLMPKSGDAAGAGSATPDQEAGSGTLTSLTLYVSPTTNTSGGNLRIRLALNGVADGGSAQVAGLFQSFTVAMPASTAGQRRVLTIPLTYAYTEGQDLSINVLRQPGDAADTVAQDIALSPQVALTLTSTGPSSPGSGSYSPPAGP
jgi:hypothetical protein